MQVSGLTINTRYKLYRTTGLFDGGVIPQNTTALQAACTAQGTGCTAYTFTATLAIMSFTQANVGSFAARR